jgi:ATP-binding protein involved in chromosome partitioning
MALSPDAVLAALRAVEDPDLHQDIVSLGFVKNLRVEGGRVSFDVELTTPACPVKDQLRSQCERVVEALEGVKSVTVRMTANVRGAPAVAGSSGQPGQGGPIPGVRNVIAVGAGKGGVGKSTVAVNLALALLQEGARVGLMDADVYGPSIPKMLGSSEAPTGSDAHHIEPNRAHGLKMISMGLLLDPEKPMIVRGPIVHTIVRQFLGDVVWGELDYLVVDLPPGTGDVALSLAQSTPVTGAVVVSTPQDVALLDVHKAVSMFRTLKIPVLGLVENMSWYRCPACGNEDPVFGHGGARAWAKQQQIPFLGEVPLHASVCVGGDAGVPALADERTPEHVSESFRTIARELARNASIAVLKRPAQPLIQIQGL